ncbi:hypothetical protein B0T18DRAFT_441791 [Schizothecium vesticola]|uniref:Uncharacterized protein n=1 Tax=Schizothecium vesticola TaxID=314040 RepID=A0AA40F8J8_9PEZI|nr:hypothetical protein B0T18DRAFT_441791 [Schizothecium vesticola]
MSRTNTQGNDLAGWLEHVETGSITRPSTSPTDKNAAASAEEPGGGPPNPRPRQELDYIAAFKSRKHLMPHWRNVLEEPRKEAAGEITILALTGPSGASTVQSTQTLAGIGLEPTSLEAAWKSVAGARRAVIVTDLSKTIINSLGATFNLSPEILEEHLVRSGYTATSYEDPDPNTWPTRFLPKQCASLRWYGLVLRHDVQPRDAHSRHLLIQDKLKWHEPLKFRKRDLHIRNNIFRREWPLSSMYRPPKRRLAWDETAEGLVDFEEGDDFENEYLGLGKDPSIVAWEERVTFCWGQDGRDRVPILLLDPAPVMDLEISAGLGADTWPVRPFSKRLAPRGPPPAQQLTGDPATLEPMTSYTTQPEERETSSVVIDWIRRIMEDAVLWRDSSSLDPLILAVFQHVRQDTVVLLGHISDVLDQISSGSLDERMMQEQLGHWRSVLGRLQSELPALAKSLGEFFVFPYPGNNPRDATLPPDLATALRELQADISSTTERCQKSHESLRAEMSLLESKRGIEEAESVSRLTELAFIFIPMTFAASLFSMQVKELADNPPPLYAFIIAALTAVTVSYALRLVQRSTMVAGLLRKWETDIRNERQVTARVIPIRSVVGWLVEKLGVRVLIVIVGSGTTALLLVPLWTRDAMDTSFRGAITAFFLLVIILTVANGMDNFGSTERLAGRGNPGLGRMWRSPDEEGEGAGGTSTDQQGSGSDDHV